MNLNLSHEQREYVASLFKRDKARISIKHQAKLDELVHQVGRVYGAEQKLKDHMVEHVQELVSARTQAYINTYRKFNVELTESDILLILKELDRLTKEELKNMSQETRDTVSFQRYLNYQFTNMVFSAKEEMELAMHERKLEQSIPETPAITSMPTVDFSFVADARIRKIIERDYTELQQLDPESTPKSVLILAGGIIEGLLIDAIIKSGHWTEKEAFERPLKDMIYPAKNKGIIAHDNITEVLRVFRNLVHPGREIRDSLVFTKDHAKHAKTSVDVMISEVRQWHIKNP